MANGARTLVEHAKRAGDDITSAVTTSSTRRRRDIAPQNIEHDGERDRDHEPPGTTGPLNDDLTEGINHIQRMAWDRLWRILLAPPASMSDDIDPSRSGAATPEADGNSV